MRSFYIRATLFSLPLVLFFAFPLWVVHLSREFLSVDKIIAQQREYKGIMLVSKTYVPFDKNILLEKFLQIRPDIVSIGNSRTLQFREEFFKQNTVFYNASDLGIGFLELIGNGKFWELLPEGYNPKLLIVGLDQSFFIKPFAQDKLIHAVAQKNKMTPNLLHIARYVYLDYFEGKFRSAALVSANKTLPFVGIQSLINHEGIRRDGSYRSGKVDEDPNDQKLEDYQFRNTLERVEKGTDLFEHGTHINKDALKKLNAFLEEAKKRDIHVVVFLPPYAPTVYEKMQAMNGGYDYQTKILPATSELFKKRGFTVFDFSDARKLGAPDAEFLDGFHASEKVYARFLSVMAERDPKLRNHVDVVRVGKDIENAASDLEIFPLGF